MNEWRSPHPVKSDAFDDYVEETCSDSGATPGAPESSE